MRGPHSYHNDSLVVVLAGAHSLGTGAACLAATTPSLIREVSAKLKERGCELYSRDKGIRALVKGKAADGQPPAVASVVVEDAGQIEC